MKILTVLNLNSACRFRLKNLSSFLDSSYFDDFFLDIIANAGFTTWCDTVFIPAPNKAWVAAEE